MVSSPASQKTRRPYRRWLVLLVALVAAAAALYVDPWGIWRGRIAKESPPVQEAYSFILKNGMEVVLVPNHRIPAVSHTLWIKTGAADDPVGKSGLAHYLEHLLFKGTPSTPEGEYDRIIEGLGGQFNAFTGADYTGYYVTIAREHLSRVMALEADRMQYLVPSDEAFDKERSVIIEERRSRTESQPQALLDEEMDAALFRRHPYGTPIIGWMHEMQKLTAQDAKDFYDRYYQPANMVLVVAGDIDMDELKQLAEQHYGTMQARAALPERIWPSEPPQRAPRQMTMRSAQVKQPVWMRSYVAPSLSEGDTEHAIPLELVAHWLGGGKTSLLHRELVVKQKKAVSVSVSYSALTRGPSQFTLRIVPAAGVEAKELQVAVDRLLSRVREEQIDREDLQRIKTLLKADVIYARDGLEPVAQVIGTLRALGLDARLFAQWTGRIDAVNASAMRSAARAVLRPQQSVTAWLAPGKDETAEQESQQ